MKHWMENDKVMSDRFINIYIDIYFSNFDDLISFNLFLSTCCHQVWSMTGRRICRSVNNKHYEYQPNSVFLRCTLRTGRSRMCTSGRTRPGSLCWRRTRGPSSCVHKQIFLCRRSNIILVPVRGGEDVDGAAHDHLQGLERGDHHGQHLGHLQPAGAHPVVGVHQRVHRVVHHLPPHNTLLDISHYKSCQVTFANFHSIFNEEKALVGAPLWNFAKFLLQL